MPHTGFHPNITLNNLRLLISYRILYSKFDKKKKKKKIENFQINLNKTPHTGFHNKVTLRLLISYRILCNKFDF